MADIIVRNGMVVNVATREVLPWEVAIRGDRIIYLGPSAANIAQDAQIFDAQGQYVLPGLISAHDHTEMTLMSVVPFAEAVLPKGTTAVVLDPHDIVNVLGMRGLRLMVRESTRTPLKTYFVVPPCVPPTSLEDGGCQVTLPDVIWGLKLPKTIGVAEAMDFRRVINREPEMVAILQWAQDNGIIIDGHCPEVRGDDLSRYTSLGPVRSDHESTSIAQQYEEIRLGMKVILRRGSVAEPKTAGELTRTIPDTSNMLLAVDGCISVEDILEHGHMLWAVRQLIAEGVHPLIAIQMGTINVARAYHLDHQIGLIAPGRLADLLLVDNLQELNLNRVMVNGRWLEDKPLYPRYNFPPWARSTVKLPRVSCDDFEIPSVTNNQRVRVIEVVDGSLTTNELVVSMKPDLGFITADSENDILKVAVFERYGNGTRSLGFVKGFGLKTGAFGGSIGQDSQNVVVVGTNDADMAVAVNSIGRINGGIVIVNNGNVVAQLRLPIAGIITDIPPQELAAERKMLTRVLHDMGCRLKDPIFTLSLLITLVVIPDLKMSNRGLVDVGKGVIVPLFV